MVVEAQQSPDDVVVAQRRAAWGKASATILPVLKRFAKSIAKDARKSEAGVPEEAGVSELVAREHIQGIRLQLAAGASSEAALPAADFGPSLLFLQFSDGQVHAGMCPSTTRPQDDSGGHPADDFLAHTRFASPEDIDEDDVISVAEAFMAYLSLSSWDRRVDPRHFGFGASFPTPDSVLGIFRDLRPAVS